MLCVEDESGEVVGCGSFLHRPTWVDGRRLRAGVLCDFAVTRAHRVAGAALAIQRALVEASRATGMDLLYGYPNEKSIAVFKRIGYQVVGEATMWVKPLHSAYKLRSVLRWKRATTLAAGPVDMALALMDRVRRWRTWMPASGRPLSGPDARADDLWERMRAGYAIMGEKSLAYLDWRYGRFVTAEHRFFGLFPSRDERLAGFAVYTVKDGKAFVHDLFTDRRKRSDEALLLALAEHLRGQIVDSMWLSYVGSPAFGERLRNVGFLRRPGTRALVLHPAGLTEPLRARVLEPANWFMLDGELDI